VDKREATDERDDGLSDQATTILELIAEGRSYDQILQRHPDLTYLDIFAAARAALKLRRTAGPRAVPDPMPLDSRAEPATSEAEISPATLPDAQPAPAKRLPAHIERARQTHRRAWTRWTGAEDAHLADLFRQGATRAEMEAGLGRQPGAIRSRLLKLGLISEDDDGQEGAVPAPTALPTPSPPQMVPTRRSRPTIEPPTSIVPGWEAFRDRLSPDQDE
jgi:hypothetical protein